MNNALIDYEVREQLVRQGHSESTADAVIAAGKGAWLWRNARGEMREWRRANGEWRLA